MAGRVLVVDDEKMIVKGLKFSLMQDYSVVDCAYAVSYTHLTLPTNSLV